MVLLSFDIEEFDMPFEYGKEIAFDEQLSISTAGTNTILDILKSKGVKATFYCTANYAQHKPDVIARIVNEGHEVASHGLYHSDFKPEHLKQSKDILEKISGQTIKGYRMARMMPVDEKEIKKAGYGYNSSINPTYLPGRYNNLKKPRRWFYQDGVLQLPSSVSPLVRFPLFWLSFHNLPMGILKWLSKITHKKDGYLNLYFHPWEFTDLKQPAKFGFPGYVSKNTGVAFAKRISDFITWALAQGYVFSRSGDFVGNIPVEHGLGLDKGILFEDDNTFLPWGKPIDALAKKFATRKEEFEEKTIFNWGKHTILNGLELFLSNVYDNVGEEQHNRKFSKIEFWAMGDRPSIEKFDYISKHLITLYGEPIDKLEANKSDKTWIWKADTIEFNLHLFEESRFKLHFTISVFPV